LPSLKQFVSKVTSHPLIVEPASYLVRRRPTRIDQATWDAEYATGHWDYLGDISEMPRFAIIAGYGRTVGPATSVLDIGCGSGQLATWVCQAETDRYAGIDISSVAIQKARDRNLSQATFEVADAATFNPGNTFEMIVFNEMLFYMPDPNAVIAHYESFLTTGGVFVISMWRCTASLRTWRDCASRLKVLDHVRFRAANTIEWDIRLCRPNKASTE
jgi:2-polyprenyl-3-methyl-5-hydroxy-6-metoxy-1,4-benzoquinol methylase